MPATRPTLCPYCGTGCGLSVTTEAGRVARVEGDARHPVNRGRTCRKPLELGSAVHAADRATQPLVRDARNLPFAAVGWDHALGHVATTLRRIVAEHGPDAVAFYISGQLLTEDYYAVNKLAKGFIGTNNVDSNSRLCMSSAVAGYTGAFGHDGPPPAYADIEQSDCMLILGSNTAACHPILWGRIKDRMTEGATVIVADPRATTTARAATLHLPVRPGTDLPLLNALLHTVSENGLLDERFVRRRTTGFAAALATARAWPAARAAEVCGIPERDILLAAELFGTAGAALALWSMGANQSTVGTLKNRALINLCLATGNLGRPGAGPLSLTGQPNAMGGRETGGLAHLLPGYRSVTDPEDRRAMAAHWGVPDLPASPGWSATELVDALLDGKVRAVLVAATNPLVSLPDSARARAAFERAELMVVQDCHHPTETSALAHVVLPAAAWPEKEGSMTNSERRVGLVRKLLDPPGQARPDWQIYAGLAAKLGHSAAFAWPDAAAVYDEFAACTAGRPCDVSGVSHERLRREGSVQWPAPPGSDGTVRLDPARAAFACTPHSDPADPVDDEWPLTLTTGRLADQWHTMSRTGKSARLRAGNVATVSVHPEDTGAAPGEPVRVVSRRGAVVLTLEHDASLPRGVAFAPFHFGALHASPGHGQLNTVGHASVDPTSKQPELKAIAVRLEPAAQVRRGRGHAPRCVIVGTGMAGLATAEALLARDDRWRVTMLGEEPDPTYNRIQLSKLLAREAGPGDLHVAARPEIDVRTGCAAARIDLAGREVTDARGEVHRYDALVVATGSRPFVPPVAGGPLHVFRTRADVRGIEAAIAEGARRAVVLGGGLLGLEAAAGLRGRGLAVTVVEAGPRLMGRQLDRDAAAMVQQALADRGVVALTGRTAARIGPESVELDDGAHVPADLVVASAGIRPETALAAAAGIPVARGISVDDAMRAGAADVLAVGECAEHRGAVHGLWAPLAEQAKVAGATIAGDPAAFHGAVTATTLKVAGLDLYTGGSAEPPSGCDELVLRDTRARTYRKLVLDGDRLVGAILLGDAADARRCTAALRGDGPPPELAAPAGEEAPDPDATICACNQVTGRQLDEAIVARSLTTVAGVARATAATTGCGGCTADVKAQLARHAA